MFVFGIICLFSGSVVLLCPLQGKLMDGKVIDSSLSMNPLVVVLGKRTVIPGK